MLKGLPWKQTELILSFLRLYPRRAFGTFVDSEDYSISSKGFLPTVKGFSVVNEVEVDVFLEFSCFPYDPVNIGNLIFGSSVSFKPSLYIWKFLIHELLKLFEVF